MPRQIIDTQSSRPAYIRRNVTLAALVIVIVALAVYFFMERGSAPQGNNPYGTVTTKEVQPPNPQAKPPGK